MEYLTAFVLMDMQVAPRIAPKVNMNHCNPDTFQRQNVRLAAQLFDHPVAAGVATYASVGRLPPEAAATALWVERKCKFFESFNGVAVKEREEGDSFKVAVTETSGHEELWVKMIEEMQQWTYLDSPHLPFVESWIQTILALLLLWIDLKNEGHTYFLVGHANQDGLENFFSLMRIVLGHLHNPSAAEFPSAFITALVNAFTGTGKKKNCKDDDAVVLVHFKALYEAAEKSSGEQANATTAPEPETTVDVPESQFEEGIAYDGEALVHLRSIGSARVLRPLLQKFLAETLCEACERVLVTVDGDPTSMSSFPATAGNLLARNPAQGIVEVMSDIYQLCGREMPQILHRSGLLAAFHTKVVMLPSVQRFRLCEEHDEGYKKKLLNEIERAAVTELLAKTSRALRNKRGKKGRRKLQQMSHQ